MDEMTTHYSDPSRSLEGVPSLNYDSVDIDIQGEPSSRQNCKRTVSKTLFLMTHYWVEELRSIRGAMKSVVHEPRRAVKLRATFGLFKHINAARLD